MVAKRDEHRLTIGVIVLLTLAVLVFFLVMVRVPLVSAANFPDEDGPLNTRLTLTGKYGTIAGGAGLELTGTNTASLNIPGTSVVAAYLYWAGTTTDDGDDTVTFQVDANAPQSLTADDTYGPSLWYYGGDGTYNHFVYVRNITSLVSGVGSHSFTLSDYTVSGSGGLAYGFGVVVLYEDPALNTSTVTLMDGLDSVYWNFPAPRNSPSSVNCITYTANTTQDRVMDFYVFAGGSEDSTDTDRPNSLHYLTGTGTPPADLSAAPGNVEIVDPFTSTDGDAWDTYTQEIVIPAGSTYACFQTNSDGVFLGPDGASFLWLMGGFTLKEQTPTAVSLSTFSADNPIALPAAGMALALLLLVSGTGMALARRRR